MKHRNRHAAPARHQSFRPLVEAFEPRQLLAWSSYAQLVGQDDAASQFANLTGAGQTIAMIDTGIDYTHANLGGGFGAGKKVIGGYDFVDNDSNPMDTDGHGTTTAGMVAASEYTYNGTTYRGVAPDAKLVALRVGKGQTISDTNIEKALKWVISNYKTYGISVVNISLGGGSYDSDFTGSQYADEFAKLADLNIMVVAASGNDGDSAFGSAGVAYPAADPNVFAVGSITAGDHISSFTQRGDELDLLAPGQAVVSTRRGGGFTTIDGTSFSSPFVAGVVALLRQAAPALRVGDLASVLRSSSTSQYDGDGDGGRTTSRYYARLNLVDAINLAKARNGSSIDNIATNRYTTVDSAYDSSGVLHLAYYDASNKDLMYATRLTTGKWSTPVRIDGSGTDVGQALSIAIDHAGHASIAYFDSTNADLKYAWFTGSKWSATTLDSKNSTGQNPSLVFDADGDPTIAYYKKSGGDLKLTTYNRTSGTWTTSVLDSEGDVGQYASLAYSSSGSTYSLAIAYADKTNGNLKYIRYSNAIGGGWVNEIVDDLSGVANVQLSLDERADGSVAAHIAYQDQKRSAVKYAYKSNTWFTSTVAGSGSNGQSVQSYVGADGLYHIVYYSATRGATYDASINMTSNAVVSTARFGTAGAVATVAVNDEGEAILVGLNKAMKSVGAWDLIEDA